MGQDPPQPPRKARLAIREVQGLQVSAFCLQVLPTAAGARTGRRLGRRQSDQPHRQTAAFPGKCLNLPLVGFGVLLGTLCVSWASGVTACRRVDPCISVCLINRHSV